MPDIEWIYPEVLVRDGILVQDDTVRLRNINLDTEDKFSPTITKKELDELRAKLARGGWIYNKTTRELHSEPSEAPPPSLSLWGPLAVSVCQSAELPIGECNSEDAELGTKITVDKDIIESSSWKGKDDHPWFSCLFGKSAGSALFDVVSCASPV